MAFACSGKALRKWMCLTLPFLSMMMRTGTGFPRVFYLMYHLYRQYFPLIALTTYAKVMEKNGNQPLAAGF